MAMNVGHHQSTYTNGELNAMAAHLLGTDPDEVEEVAVIIRIKGGKLSLGGTRGTMSAGMLLMEMIHAVVSS